MRQLREKFPNELVIIGVHAAKFPGERPLENVRNAIRQQGIRHPVVNDNDFNLWSQYGVRGWPTVVLVDPLGKVVAARGGEIDAEAVTDSIASLITEFDNRGLLVRTPLNVLTEQERSPETHQKTMLRYPSKLLIGPQRSLYISDTGNHRVLLTTLSDDGLSAEVWRSIGDGTPGLRDGALYEAQLRQPRGLAQIGSTLYIADTGNHAIRKAHLQHEMMRTVAGTGRMGHGSTRRAVPEAGAAREVDLRSPWALAAPVLGKTLLIAMAGSHQIWALEDDAHLRPLAGTGVEALIDGPLAEAAFNQPSDLLLHQNRLYVADAEASAIRQVALPFRTELAQAPEEPGVETLVGLGLFAFGDADGTGDQVRLQHPLGLAARENTLYIADTYNHKIKTLDLQTGVVETLIGTGTAGAVEGSFHKAQLYEPDGLALVGDQLYIADTNNHCVRVADLRGGGVTTLSLTHASGQL